MNQMEQHDKEWPVIQEAMRIDYRLPDEEKSTENLKMVLWSFFITGLGFFVGLMVGYCG